MMPPAHCGAEDSVRFLLTKNPARSFSCPWCQVHRILFERFPRPWQTVGREEGSSHYADSNLAFFKVVGYSSGVPPPLVHLHSHFWWADASQKWTSTTHGVNPRVPPLGLESHCGPVRYEWLYHIGPKIIKTLKPTMTTTWGHSRQGYTKHMYSKIKNWLFGWPFIT